MKRWERRRYFCRQWEPTTQKAVYMGGMKIPVAHSMPAVTIFGYEDDSEYNEDHASIDAAMKRGFIFGRWFSVNCRDGEPGTQPMDELMLITKKDFEAAQKRGWTSC